MAKNLIFTQLKINNAFSIQSNYNSGFSSRKTVSYTHLDVYKRQVLDSSKVGEKAKAIIAKGAEKVEQGAKKVQEATKK